MSKDLLLFETGNGGDLKIISGDIGLSETLFQNMYISMFGGNIEVNTTGNEITGEIREDYWGNSLFNPNEPNKQFNSNTERTLSNIVLNSSGRIEIQKAVESDLDHLSNVINFTVEVSITSRNSVSITIYILQLANQQEKRLQLLFDNAKNELLIEYQV